MKPEVIENVDIWYRNSPTTYKQLTNNGTIIEANDIGISMTMNTTNGEKYNSVYNEERLFPKVNELPVINFRFISYT